MSIPITIIPEPWTELSRNGLIVTAAPNKVFDFSHAPFADQFTVDGQPILARPITLQVQGNGVGDTLQTITAVPTFTSASTGEIVYSWTWTGINNLAASGTITVQYDGVVRYDFKLKRTASKKFKKAILTIPYVPEIGQYLLKWPRSVGSDFNLQDFGAAGSSTWNYTWQDSNSWPKQLLLHNTRFGIEWLTASDANLGMTGYVGSTATIVADESASTLTINMINNDFPGAGMTDLNYTMWLTPLPLKNSDPTHNLPRVGDCGTTPTNTQFRPLAEECPDAFFSIVGSLLKRSGTWGSPNTDFDTKRTARLARGLDAQGYVSINCWSPTDPEYDPAWYVRDAYVNHYRDNCDAGNPLHNYNIINCGASGFYDIVTNRVQQALEYCEGIYYDVAEPIYLAAATDDAGVSRHRYVIAENREIYRELQVVIQYLGRHSLMHADSNTLAAVHGCADFQVGGEQYRNLIINTVDTNERRRWPHNSMPPATWRGEQATGRLFGMSMVVIPQVYLTDYNATNERIATECYLSACASHNAGFWQSFSLNSVVSPYFDALQDSGLDDPASFIGYWDTPNLLVTNAEDSETESQLSHFVQGNKLTVLCCNLQDTDRMVPVSLRARATGHTILFSTDGRSAAESRTTAYTATVTGDTSDFEVGVSRHGLTVVQFDIDLAGTYTVGNGAIHVPGARDGGFSVPARGLAPFRPGAIEGRIKGY